MEARAADGSGARRGTADGPGARRGTADGPGSRRGSPGGPGPAPPRRVGLVRGFLARPEAAVAVGAIGVWALFAVLAGPVFRTAEATAAILNAAAPLGIVAAAVALLMIGGEFDLSVGSVIGFASMVLMLLVVEAGWPIGVAILATGVVCAGVGAVNGWLVVRTGVPSFLVTLGTLFVFRGLAIALPRRIAGRTQLGGLDEVAGYEWARALFAAEAGPFRISIAWWIAATVAAAWVLRRTRVGNRILATGGDADAARRAGVRTARVKVGLFVTTALAAWLVATIQAVRFTGADALRGELVEFRAIAAAVIGGTLLTGGYGSAVGAALGAFVFATVQQGIVMTGVDADWFQVFLGVVLVAAVLVNDRVRRVVTGAA